MLKLYFLHTIYHNSNMFRYILSGGGDLWQIVFKNIDLTLVHLLVLLYELFVIVRALVTLRRK
jgi:hypothetical protein